MAFLSIAFFPFSGCIGGTSTEAGNPGLNVEIRDGDKAVKFHGWVEFYANGSNPEFIAPYPDDGTSPPRVMIGGNYLASYLIQGESSFNIPRNELERNIYSHPILSLAKSGAASVIEALPDFNVVLIGFDSTAGWINGIRLDTKTGIYGRLDGSENGTLIIRISRERGYSGAVDTSTEAGRPLALFVPGTAYYAKVNQDSFHFEGLPQGKLPLRWVSSAGLVYDMPDSLGADWTHPLKPGTRIDSISIPAPVPTLAQPAAEPAGQFAFTDSVEVVLSAEPGAAIYYTSDGSTPEVNSNRTIRYSKPVVLRASATLFAFATMRGKNSSPISANNYVLLPATPLASPAGKAFHDSLVVSLSAKSKGAVIHYTLDGTDPSAKSAIYGTPLVLDSTTRVKALAVTGLGLSRILEEKYILLSDSSATPP
ncbi:MAG: chitobiase/beta-hexosaminidase C-terminal domain-containing protein [Fibrobacterota bacterium]|nr:chitobiase/beta-hexosaminidase C-terminal domain-containing protein [Fibrobacterota bacterium]